jgi:hypothetical protein
VRERERERERELVEDGDGGTWGETLTLTIIPLAAGCVASFYLSNIATSLSLSYSYRVTSLHGAHPITIARERISRSALA